jgi:hypothetical protein
MRNERELLNEGLYKLLDNCIYRYRSIDKGFEMLENQELFLSAPDAFNDPFDCYEGLIKFKLTKQFMREYITNNDMLRRISTRHERRKKEKQILANPKSVEIDKFFENQKKQFGICCFSWDYKSIVMWAHYAGNHNGMCIGFRHLNPVEENLYGIYPVEYTSEIKQYEFDSFDDLNYWQHWFCTKSKMWKYEEEVRLISRTYNGKLKFPKEAVTEIYLGLSTSKIDEKQIINTLIKHQYPKSLRLYKMNIDNKSFSLLPVEIKWNNC